MAKPSRRGSVEVQQLTMWKHQQNLEEIKMLKANNSIPTPQSPKMSQPPLNPAFQEKLSKLSARKLKSSGEFTKTSSASELLTRSLNRNDFVETASRVAPAIQHVPLQQNEATSAENASRLGTPRSDSGNVVSKGNQSAEIDALLKEKQHWLRTMHQDNAKMAQMLKDLREAKMQLAQKMDEIEVERRSLQLTAEQCRVNPNHTEIEDFLKEESELADEKRHLSVPEAHVEEGAQLLRDLLLISGRFRVNQGETHAFFYKTVRQTVQSFISGAITASEQETERERALRENTTAFDDIRKYQGTGGIDPLDEYRQHLETLRALAATGPGNLRAAENVAVSVSSSLLRAAGERTVSLLQMNQSAVEKKLRLTLRDEITALKQENNALKGSLAQLRKSNVQLRMKSAASFLLPSSTKNASNNNNNTAQNNNGSIRERRGTELTDLQLNTSEYGDAFSVHPYSPTQDDVGTFGADQQREQREEESQLLGTTGTAGLLQSEQRLPRAVEHYLLSQLAEHALEIIEGHPLAATLSRAMVQSLSKELSKEVRGIAAAAFFAFMHHRQGLLELPDSLLNGTLTYFAEVGKAGEKEGEKDGEKEGEQPEGAPRSAADKRVCEQVREAVEYVLQISSVHTELSALATLYLTYLHCRPKAAHGATEDTDMDNVSVELGLRKERRTSRRGSAPHRANQDRGEDLGEDMHEEHKDTGYGDRAGQIQGLEDEDEESLQGISIDDNAAAGAAGGARPQTYSVNRYPPKQYVQGQKQTPLQQQVQAQSQSRRLSNQPPAQGQIQGQGQMSSPQQRPSTQHHVNPPDYASYSGTESFHSAVESTPAGGTLNSPVFLRGSRPHPSSSPLPRYMQAKGAGKR